MKLFHTQKEINYWVLEQLKITGLKNLIDNYGQDILFENVLNFKQESIKYQLAKYDHLIGIKVLISCSIYEQIKINFNLGNRLGNIIGDFKFNPATKTIECQCVYNKDELIVCALKDLKKIN